MENHVFSFYHSYLVTGSDNSAHRLLPPASKFKVSLRSNLPRNIPFCCSVEPYFNLRHSPNPAGSFEQSVCSYTSLYQAHVLRTINKQVDEMSYLQVTAVRPSLRVPDQYNTLRRSSIQCFAPMNIFNLHNASKPSVGSSKRCTELMKCNVVQKTSASRYQQCMPVCSFGGKGESKNSDEASPWKSIEKAMSSFKKEPSLEDVLRQQMENKDYYDGDPPSGGGGGGGGGFGGTDDEGFAGLWDDILQVTLAILALIVLYMYIIARDQLKLFIRDTVDFLLGKKGPRLRTIMYEFAQFYQKFRVKVPYDPYWLEKAIITTPTWWDSPEKYRRILNIPDRSIKSSKSNLYSDSDGNAASSDNLYGDSDNDDYNDKAYDDDKDDNAYSEDVDDEY
ncbi:hypothetical protein HanRHA438_Chr11g0513471 [Helianthus annuus]|uniref:Uncharacterized protein n=2 Tax=Helianthus annuus TaxID=4232 RepID=A0A251TN06_HELAN|nr:hypothetical protein HanXRQr2_Chr11g0500711 [Helianthus annuus]KAJ0502283.1 hypothetical protein HanHA300_Chr11g0411021 [Helianthus annuus]KAJ0510298.1 hypothetical protein HanIR_Chr11g0539101 [Helianthus annuus]KAJ0518203.1 hypothetical protein HanHA89_Chr11g0434671 [Helianthus annuus]KAJ0686234.1 hypothetical protein HanLR1_Chr11g0412321 [Helianthus annuus]